MAGEVEKLSGKLGIDTTDFKTAIGAANRELRVLESSFKAGAAGLQDWTKDATGLESRVKTLTSQMDIQKLKVSALAAEHQRLAEENGATSRAAQDAEIKLNKETETLNKMQTELNKTESTLTELEQGEKDAGNAATDMGDKVEASGSKVETFKSIMGGAGAITKVFITSILAVGTAAIAGVAMLGGLGLKAADTAEQFTDMSNQTGISTTRLQELKYAGEIVGVSLDTITGANSKLIRSMAGAKDGTGAQAEAFKTLGVSVTDTNGNLRDNQDVFADTIDALGKIENPAERDALAMDLFGKSAQELNPLIKAGSEEMARLSEEAHTAGAVMSEEGVASASAFKDKLDGLKMGFDGVLAQIGLAFIPGLSGIADQAKGYLGDLVGVVQGSGGDVGKIADGLGELLGTIVTDLAAQAPQLLQVGLGLITSIMGSIMKALPTLLPAAINIITSLVQFIVQALPTLIQAGIQIILMLVNVLIENLPMLIDAALQAVIALATGLAAALPELIPAVIQAILTIVQTLIDNLPMLIDAALQLILGLATGLVAAIPVLIPQIPKIVKAIFDALVQALPMIGQAALQLITTLANGIISNLPMIGKAAGELMGVLINGIQDLISSLWDVGSDIVMGLWNGIQANAGWFYDQISGFFLGIIAAAKSALGIQSPSKAGKSIGRNFMTSTAIGAAEAMNEVQRTFALMTGKLAIVADSGMSGRSGSNVNNDNRENYDFWGPVFVNGPQGQSLGKSIKGRRF